VIAGHPVDASDNARSRAGPTVIQHPHSNETHCFGYAVRCASDGTGYVCPVTVSIGGSSTGGDCVVAEDCARRIPKLLVGPENTGVDDVCIDSRTGLLVSVGQAEGSIALIDPVDSPCRTRLRGDEMNRLILFDISDPWIVPKGSHRCGREPASEAFDRRSVAVGRTGPVLLPNLVDFAVDIGDGVSHHDDVRTGNGVR
jgi:hypothetical protein